jgi:hypothetical protein
VNFIWRRVIVACFLALAVSGMHWTAAAGTWYELRGYHEGPGQERNVNLIIALCLVSLSPNILMALLILSPVFIRVRCVLLARLPQATPAKDAERSRPAGRTCCRHFRCRWSTTSQSGRSDAMSDHHTSIPPASEFMHPASVVTKLTFDRHSTTNSTPRILCSTGCSECHETGLALWISSLRCANIYNQPDTFKQQIHRLILPTADPPSIAKMTLATLLRSENYSASRLMRSRDLWIRACRIWEHCSKMCSQPEHS